MFSKFIKWWILISLIPFFFLTNFPSWQYSYIGIELMILIILHLFFLTHSLRIVISISLYRNSKCSIDAGFSVYSAMLRTQGQLPVIMTQLAFLDVAAIMWRWPSLAVVCWCWLELRASSGQLWHQVSSGIYIAVCGTMVVVGCHIDWPQYVDLIPILLQFSYYQMLFCFPRA